MRMRAIFSVCLIAMLAAACGGASQYFEIEDPSTGRIYYANAVERNRDGSVKFKDQVSGASVSIQNSEVRPLDKSEYRERKERAIAAATETAEAEAAER